MGFPFVKGLKIGLPSVSSESCGCAFLPPGAVEAILHSDPAVVGSERRMAEGVGNPPTSACVDPVFETGAASLYLPAFPKAVECGELKVES
jgi:hypothetical protein